MEDLVIAKKSDIVSIANSIRAKTGKTGGLSLSQMQSDVGGITPTVSVSKSGLITATTGDKSVTNQLTTQSAKTVTPSTSVQTAVASGVYTTGEVKVAAIPSSYIQPSGTKTITTNGTHDVKSYASATVNVAGGGSVETCTVEISSYSTLYAISYMTVNDAGEVTYACITPNSKQTQITTCLCGSVVAISYFGFSPGIFTTNCETLFNREYYCSFGITASSGNTATIILSSYSSGGSG